MSLADAAKWKRTHEEVQSAFDDLNKFDLGVVYEIDTESFKGKDIDQVRRFAWSAPYGIRDVAKKSDSERVAIKERLTSVKISYGKPEYKMDGTTFLFKTDLGETEPTPDSVRSDVCDWLMNNL